MKLHFVLLGAPRTKKTSNRIVRAGKRGQGCLRIVPSAAHESWKRKVLGRAIAVARASKETPILMPVNVRAHFYRDALRGDAAGYYQALADLLQAAGVIGDDKWIASWDGSRLRKDKDAPRIEVWITPSDS